MNDEHQRPATPDDRPTPADVDQTQPLQQPPQVQPIGPPTPYVQPTEPPAPSSTASEQPGIRDRIWSLRTVAVAAITAVALSGAGGAALASVSNGGSDDPGGFRRAGFGPPGRVDGRIPGQVNGQMPGQIPRQANGQVPGQMNGQAPGQTNQKLPTQPRTGTIPRRQPSGSDEEITRARST